MMFYLLFAKAMHRFLLKSNNVGDCRVNPPKSSVDHLTPQFKQTNNEVPRSAHGNSSSGSVRERKYITLQVQSIKVYKTWFTHLVHHTITHYSLHRSLAEVFQHNIVHDNGYMGVPHPCIYGTQDPSPLLIRRGVGSIEESMHRGYNICKT